MTKIPAAAQMLSDWLRKYAKDNGLTPLDVSGMLHPNVPYSTVSSWLCAVGWKIPMSARNRAAIRRMKARVEGVRR